MHLFLVSWFSVAFSVLPPRLDVGMHHEIAARREDVERFINAPGVYLAKVSLIANGRRKEVKLLSRVEE